jgi:hypothetical protein
MREYYEDVCIPLVSRRDGTQPLDERSMLSCRRACRDHGKLPQFQLSACKAKMVVVVVSEVESLRDAEGMIYFEIDAGGGQLRYDRPPLWRKCSFEKLYGLP